MRLASMAGVYIVHLVGTNRVYVGESSQCVARFLKHLHAWCWHTPDAFAFHVVLEETDESRRRRWECRLSIALRKRGFEVVSRSDADYRRTGWRLTPEQLRENGRRVARAVHAALTPEQRSAKGRRAWAAGLGKQTPEQRLANSRKGAARTNAMRAEESVCRRGHAFDASNTHIRTNGARRCRKCDALRARDRRREQAA